MGEDTGNSREKQMSIRLKVTASFLKSVLNPCGQRQQQSVARPWTARLSILNHLQMTDLLELLLARTEFATSRHKLLRDYHNSRVIHVFLEPTARC